MLLLAKLFYLNYISKAQCITVGFINTHDLKIYLLSALTCVGM